MTTFDLHILRRTLLGFVLLIATLVVFFIVLHYVEYVDDFFDRGATMRQVFTVYYPSYIPEIVKLTSPLAIFLSCVYVTGKLAQELQLMALQMSGVSIYRLMRPYVMLAVAVTAALFWFNGWVVPRSNQTVLEFERQYLKDAARSSDASDIHRQNSPGTFLSVGYFDRDAGMAHRVSLQRFTDDQRLAYRLDANRMEWVDSVQTWRIHNAVQRDFTPQGQETRTIVASLDTTLNVYPRDLARLEGDVESMTVPNAAAYVASLERSGAGNLGRTLVAYYGKFAYPFANLILALMAVPLASVRRRGGQAIQIGVGLLTAFVYLAVVKLTEPFGYAGALPPILAVWLPHGFFLVVAVVLILRARK